MLPKSLLISVMSLLGGGVALAQPAVIDQTAPAPASGVASPPNPDPWEGFNRKSYAVFRYLDSKAIRPASVFYAHAVPHVVRKGLHNAIQNVGSPVIFFNDLLQLHGTAAAQTLGRFAINSTAGLAGLRDVATASGIPYHANSFGTTLGRYGVGPGPFVFIPVLGPSDVRDLFGSGVDAVSDPLTWIRYTGRWEVGAAKTVIGGLDTRANADPQLKQIDAMATDPYATLRSLYLQNRQAQITGGKVDVEALPDFGPEPVETNEAGTAGAPEATIGPPGAASALPSKAAPTTAQPPTDSDPATTPPASAPQPQR